MNQPPIKRRSISHKLILYIILFSSVVTLVGTTIQVYTEYARDIKSIESAFQDIETSHLPNIINSLWAIDLEFLQTELTGIAMLPDIQFLEIITQNGPLLSAGTFQAEETIKKQFALTYSFKNKTIDLGTLHVYASLNGVHKRIVDRVLVILITQGIQTFLVSTFIFVLFFFLIGRHLITMSDYTKALRFRELDKPLIIKRSQGSLYLDELRQLELAINEMRENITSDIVKREHVENQLRESETKYRTLLENLPQKIFYKNTESVYITCNEKLARELNIKKEAIAGKTDFDFFPSALAEKYRKDDRQVIESGVSKTIEEDYLIHGKEYTVHTVKSPIFDAEGKVIGLLGIFWDITEKKKAELELQKTKDELEKRVRERTARLQETNRRLEEEIAIHKQTEEKLTYAKLDAERANQAKSEFLSNISHELRTPMHHILNYSRFGLEKIDQVPRDKLIHYFSQIRKTGNRLMVLLNDLLDLSKLESGRAEYKMKRHNVVLIMEEAITEIGILAREKNVFIESDTDHSEIIVKCDAYKIGQVFRNLLSNAIKFSPTDKLVTISLKRITDVSRNQTKEYLHGTVSDHGPGIPANEMESIFDKFTQSSLTKTGAGGSGLGLAICKEIVEGHGGKIWASNNSTGGAIFHFSLPISADAE